MPKRPQKPISRGVARRVRPSPLAKLAPPTAGLPAQPRQPISPFRELGVGGTAIWGGYVDPGENHYKLQGHQRHVTIADLLSNISIVAAGVRYFLNLVAKPAWRVEPAEDIGEGESSDEAKEIAEFVEDVLYDMNTSWTRIIRRTANYRFHGFGIQEWTAKLRTDGRIGMQDIRPRPQHTIVRWDIDEKGNIKGVWQQGPNTMSQIYLPRGKLIYAVDDTLSDSPEGMGLFRHLVEPADRLKQYLKLEGIGFERDMRGIPIGRVPYTAIRKAVEEKRMTAEKAEAMIAIMENFVAMEVRGQNTGLVLDSQPYESAGAQGVEAGSFPMWGLELLTGGATVAEELNVSINRIMEEMARIIGVESLLLGSGEAGGNRALSKDKSQNLYLVVNSALGDLEEAFSKDLVDPLFLLNGLPDELKPWLKHEDAAFKDVAQITAALREMATAGAVLAPDDPVIDDVRDILGVSRQPEPTPEMMGMVPGEEEPELEEEEEEESTTKKRAGGRRGKRRPFDKAWDESKHPRVPAGNSDGGQFADTGRAMSARLKGLISGTRLGTLDLNQTQMGLLRHKMGQQFSEDERVNLLASTLHHGHIPGKADAWDLKTDLAPDQLSAMSDDDLRAMLDKLNPEITRGGSFTKFLDAGDLSSSFTSKEAQDDIADLLIQASHRPGVVAVKDNRYSAFSGVVQDAALGFRGDVLDRLTDHVNMDDATAGNLKIFSSDYDKFEKPFLETWAATGGTPAHRRAYAATGGTDGNTGKEFWFGERPLTESEKVPSMNMKKNLEAMHAKTQAFYTEKFTKKGVAPDLSQKFVTVQRGVGGSFTSYTPGPVESWTTDKRTPERFGKMMARSEGTGYARKETYTVLTADVPYSSVLFTHESAKGVFPSDTDLKGKKEVAIFGGGLKNLKAEVKSVAPKGY